MAKKTINFQKDVMEPIGSLKEDIDDLSNRDSESKSVSDWWIKKNSIYKIGTNIVDFTTQGESSYPTINALKSSLSVSGESITSAYFNIPFEKNKKYAIYMIYYGWSDGTNRTNVRIYRGDSVIANADKDGYGTFEYFLESDGTEKIRIYSPKNNKKTFKIHELFIAEYSNELDGDSSNVMKELISSQFDSSFANRFKKQIDIDFSEYLDCSFISNKTIGSDGKVKDINGYAYSSALHVYPHDAILLEGDKPIYRIAVYSTEPNVGITKLKSYVNEESTYYSPKEEEYICLCINTAKVGNTPRIQKNAFKRFELLQNELSEIYEKIRNPGIPYEQLKDMVNSNKISLDEHKRATNPHGISMDTLGIYNASPEHAGLMSATDKAKLDNLINQGTINITGSGITKNASAYGFLPTNDGDTNSTALQDAVNGGGMIIVDIPGTYNVSKSCQLDSYTTLLFGNGVFINRVKSSNGITAKYPFMNKGLLTGEFNEYISIIGLHLKCNQIGMGTDINGLFGQRGQLAFCNIKNLLIDGLVILDGDDKNTYNVHIQNFENVKIENTTIISQKDGIHFGKGKGFIIRHCFFKTNDDAIALNAHDYPTGTMFLGWIENGIIEDIHFLSAPEMNIGRGIYMLGGSWLDWNNGMTVRSYGDTVVSNGRIYRTVGTADSSLPTIISTQKPTHESGTVEYSDGVKWLMAQDKGIVYNCGVKNVVIRDIYNERESKNVLTFNADDDAYSRGIYPNSIPPVFSNIIIENVSAPNTNRIITSNVPIDNVRIRDVNYEAHQFMVYLYGNVGGVDYGNANILIDGTMFNLTDSNKIIVKCDSERYCKVKISNSLGNFDKIKPSVVGTNISIVSNDVGIE